MIGKRIAVAAAGAALVMSLGLFGCGGQQQAAEQDVQQEEAQGGELQYDPNEILEYVQSDEIKVYPQDILESLDEMLSAAGEFDMATCNDLIEDVNGKCDSIFELQPPSALEGAHAHMKDFALDAKQASISISNALTSDTMAESADFIGQAGDYIGECNDDVLAFTDAINDFNERTAQ